MNNIGSLLEKFKKLLQSTKAQKETIIKVVREKAGIELGPNDIDIKNSILYIKSHPLRRNEVYMKKALILKEFQALFGNEIRDIK